MAAERPRPAILVPAPIAEAVGLVEGMALPNPELLPLVLLLRRPRMSGPAVHLAD